MRKTSDMIFKKPTGKQQTQVSMPGQHPACASSVRLPTIIVLGSPNALNGQWDAFSDNMQPPASVNCSFISGSRFMLVIKADDQSRTDMRDARGTP